MDTALCHAHLQNLLVEESGALQELAALLEQEYEFITADDVEALDKAGAQRDGCVGKLLKIDAARMALCRNTGRAADKLGLLALIKWCDTRGALHQQWQANAQALNHMRMLNDRNGALVNSRLKRAEVLLESLNGVARNEKVYTARGNAYQQNAAGRVCNVQV